MLTLPESLKAWQTENFSDIFKREVCALDHQLLPLQQGLSLSSYVSNEKISVVINRTREDDFSITIYTAIFYSGIIAGCSCSDDPTPLDTQAEHCELRFSINKHSAETTVKLIAD